MKVGKREMLLHLEQVIDLGDHLSPGNPVEGHLAALLKSLRTRRNDYHYRTAGKLR